ncbi:Alpha/Beta hydrolase protein [Diaporthe sp. PMI_573]|nr:Alpha/Beta hydrolase protein [Diaporthaceae sp. PMI_573]
MSIHPQFVPAKSPESAGYPGLHTRTATDDEYGLIIHYDQPIILRDGIKIYADVYRPKSLIKCPVLLAWTPYGKHVNPWLAWNNMKGCGVPTSVVSKYCGFETPDPAYWCKHDYIVIVVDPRGYWGSEGDATFMSDTEAQDCFETIEWAARQEWSSGDVGMSGVSYLAWSQWRVAALNPPSLKAINPNEGVTDFYREVARHGGVPCDFFEGIQDLLWSYGRNMVEDISRMVTDHPYFDAYWASKNPDLSKITVPAYVVAGWGDHGLHTRGTLRAFRAIKSEQKWLKVHGRKKFQSFYEDQDRQLQFFDKFLKGKKSEVDHWPKVKLEIRERYFEGNYRDEIEWPLSRTVYTELFLESESRSLGLQAVVKVSQAVYDVSRAPEATESLSFDYTVPQDTELTGYSKLKLWVEARGADDMDIFVRLDKFDRSGNRVEFPWRSNEPDGAIVQGWLRVSHRELDDAASTLAEPVLQHQRELKLTAGEIVPVEVEIWATSVLLRKDEKLRVTLTGSDPHPGSHPMNGHPKTVNRGSHVIWTGGQYDSKLVVPVIPR